jgi:CRP-like cAMP-binding protein
MVHAGEACLSPAPTSDYLWDEALAKDLNVLITIERVIALKSVDFFANTPDNILASVAAIANEKEVNAGETFIEKGATDYLLYIIVQGEVEVHDGDTVIATLKAGESVGEMQVLDPAPRSASVTAKTDTLLLSIEKPAFDDVMTEQPEIAKDVIMVLTRRLRATTAMQVK